MGCRGGLANGKEEELAERLGEVVSVAWLGWCEGAELESLSVTEIGMMLRDSAWREVQWKWGVGTWDNSPSVQSHDTFEYI